MTIRRAEVQTTMLNPQLEGGYIRVPVFYTDELIQTDIFDFAFSSVIGGFMPYLFVGYFTDGENLNQWYFSNARRHEELRQAVEQDLKKRCHYTYGQIWFNSTDLHTGKLHFDRLELHSKLPNEEEAKEHLFKVIRPDLLHERFEIYQARQ